MSTVSKSGYSVLQIFLHWIIAALVLFQLIFGESMTTVVDAAESGSPVSTFDQFIATAHYWVGISILALLFVRLAVRLMQGTPEETHGPRLMIMAGKAAHIAFYLLLAAVPVTGLLATYVSGEFGDIHALGKPAFIVLIVVHAGAALFHQFVLKDGTMVRMLVPGEKN